MSQTPSTPQSSNHSWIDVTIKLAPTILSILGFFWGIYQFNSQQNRNAKEEFDRRMFSNSLESYSKMTQIVGKIITLKLPVDSVKYDSLQSAFNETYWGSLLLVEQDNVRKALRELKGEISDVRSGKGDIGNIILRQDFLAEQFRAALKTYRDPK